MAKKAITIDLGDAIFRNGSNRPQRQDIPEVDKTPQWYFRNAAYYLTFYNQPIGSLRFDASPTDRNITSIPEHERNFPVQHMLRMMMYYLGKQPNLDFAYLTQNVKDINMQAQWHKGQDIAEFVNYFRGLMLQRLSRANWTAKSVSRETQNKYADMYLKLETMLLLAPYLKQIEEQDGLAFRPMQGAEKLEVPEDIERLMETNFYDQGALTATDLANGFWYTNNWAQKAVKSFMHTVIAGTTAWWHRVENGRLIEDIIQPYQLIWDNRFDDDFGAMDEFRGVVEPLNAYEATQRRFEGKLSQQQIDEIYTIAGDDEQMKLYNTARNINWWTHSGNNVSNTITAVTVYWRTRREVSKVKAKNRFGNETIRKKQSPDEPSTYFVNDIAYATILGNKYLIDWGYVDNLVESVEDPGRPEFPIFRFRPNTFLGDSISEVSRIHKMQDEMDMLDFKIREMIGRAKGKTYIIHGDKLGEGTSVKELYDDFSDMGIHVSTGTSGEAGDVTDRKQTVEVVDLTLDPNISRLAELYRERKERMGRVTSTSVISLGQQTRYIGYGQQQSSIAQNQLGVSYLLDGFMDFLVMNMRYAVNKAKFLYSQKEDEEVQFLIGEKGFRYLKFTKDIRFERFMVMLNINDSIDEEGRKRILSYAQAWSQNPTFGVSPSSILKLESSKSYTEAVDMLDFEMKRAKKEQSQQQQAMQEAQMQMKQASEMFTASLQQLKEDNANYRAELAAWVKGATQLHDTTQEPAMSPLQPQLQMQTQQIQQQMQQQQMQQQMMQQQQQGGEQMPPQQ
jgi:hypothetical protein